MPKNERYIVGLDIGTHTICCIVAEMREGGSVEVVGYGSAPSRGLRKDSVVHPEATVEAIKTAVEEAELMAGVAVDRAVVGIAGAHIRSFNSRGVIHVTGKDGSVSRDDLRRVMDAARAVSIPSDREVLHVLPQEFVLDEHGGIAQPVGMNGSKLEANVHIVTASTTAIQNLINCVNQAGIEVRDTVLEQLAIAESVLSRDERELGVALIDVGGGTTDLAVFERGALWHTAVLPVGGDHFTNDLAVGLRTPIPDAERLKIKFGSALSTLVDGDEAIEVPSVGGRRPRLLSRQVMAEILQPRAEEVFALIRAEIARAGFERLLNAGVVLSGGGSLLPGMVEVAESVFGLPVRTGSLSGVPNIDDPGAASPYATALGLALFGFKNQSIRPQKSAIPNFLPHWLGVRVRTWFAGRS
jgi:cell division protein FtsA